MILTNWLRRFRAGSPLCRFDPKSWNRVANVLESIEGVGCRIAKTENGWGWQIIVGYGSDTEPPPGFSDGTTNRYPFGPQYPFGISIAGDIVAVYETVVYRGGAAHVIGPQTLQIATEGDYIAMKCVPGARAVDDVFGFEVWPSGDGIPHDKDGAIYRAIHQFSLATITVDEVEVKTASWLRALWRPGDLGTMGY